MYYINPNEIISSLVTPLMDTSKRAREFIVEISLNDAPVRRRIAVAFRARGDSAGYQGTGRI